MAVVPGRRGGRLYTNGQPGTESTEAGSKAGHCQHYLATAIYFHVPTAIVIIMADHAEVQKAIDVAVEKGQYPDRSAAVAGLTKQLIDHQKGALKIRSPPTRSAA
jgi:hypothetical protein